MRRIGRHQHTNQLHCAGNLISVSSRALSKGVSPRPFFCDWLLILKLAINYPIAKHQTTTTCDPFCFHLKAPPSYNTPHHTTDDRLQRRGLGSTSRPRNAEAIREQLVRDLSTSNSPYCSCLSIVADIGLFTDAHFMI